MIAELRCKHNYYYYKLSTTEASFTAKLDSNINLPTIADCLAPTKTRELNN